MVSSPAGVEGSCCIKTVEGRSSWLVCHQQCSSQKGHGLCCTWLVAMVPVSVCSLLSWHMAPNMAGELLHSLTQSSQRLYQCQHTMVHGELNHHLVKPMTPTLSLSARGLLIHGCSYCNPESQRKRASLSCWAIPDASENDHLKVWFHWQLF